MNNSLAIGDILITKKLGFIDHKGVYLGSNSVLTNTPERGEHVTTLADFAGGQPVKVQRTGANFSSVLENARRILSRPKPYNPALRNCEHTSSETTAGKAESPSVIVGLIVAALGVAFVARR